MKKVVRFPLERTRMNPDQQPGNAQAEIIIFPGVRIERREFCLGDRQAKSRRPRSPAQRS